jgi:hypothetical protein
LATGKFTPQRQGVSSYSAAAIGEETIMADAVEPVGQAVQQEAADELVRIERHQAGRVAMTIVAPAESHARRIGADQAAVGDGDPVGVAAEIGQHMFGRSEGRLGINDPALGPQRPERGGEGRRAVQRAECAEEAQPPLRVGCLEPLQEQPPEQAGEHMDGKEEVRAAGYPALAIARQRAAGNQAMDMRMVGEGLPPCMKDGDEAKLAAEMLGIGGDGLERLGHGVEQDGVDQRLVLVGDGGNLGWQREHDMEIRHRQQIDLAGGQPSIARGPLALGAMPVAARIISHPGVGAVSATLDMAAEGSGPAQFDCRHHPAFDAAEMTIMGGAITRAVAAEDIRHLETRAHGSSLRTAAPPRGSGGRVGSALRRSWLSRHGCSAPSSTGCYVPVALG